jgi:DHA2 family multidrug resistance protein
LRLLFQRNFGFATLANGLLGAVLYGSTYVLPLYLSQMQGYNAEQIGEVLAWVGLPQLALIPLVPRLMRAIDSRVLIGAGLALFAVSNLMNTDLNADLSGPQLFWPNIVRAIGQAVVLAPLSVVATMALAPRFAASASALFNMTRNLGGAIGIAALETFLTKREQFHSNILSGAVSLFAQATRLRIAVLTHYFAARDIVDPALARHKAIIAIGTSLRQQAYFMAYSDTFDLLGVAVVVALCAVLCLKSTRAAPR